MAVVTESLQIAAPCEEVWAFIGAFDALHTWHPAISASEIFDEDGVTYRRLTLGNGETIVESMDAHSNEARSYSYTMTDFGPLPLSEYRATLSVDQEDDGSLVSWTGTFEPKGVPKFVVADAVSRLFKAGFEGISQHFAGTL
jgi:ligand-binding SRPBCC domain-containing protein